MKDSSQRIAYWDNLKAILIFLVVVGHFLLPITPREGVVFSVYTWIYLFHMPAFVFVSGCFSKSFVKNKDINKLIGFIVLYVFFNVAIWILKMIFTKKFYIINIMTPNGASWYLMSMLMWYCLIPYCANVKPTIMIPLSIVVSLLVGLEKGAGTFLAITRFFILYPFFLLGYYFDSKYIYIYI